MLDFGHNGTVIALTLWQGLLLEIPRVLRFIPTVLVAFVTTAGTAFAQAGGGIAIPEPTDGALFAIGLAGLIIGRHVARRKED